MEERIDLVLEPKPRTTGVSIAIVASLVLHALLITYLVLNYHPVAPGQNAGTQMVRYVELMRQNPREFVEAPGPKVSSAPLNAPWSDANRRASTPNPTGGNPTKRPGDGAGFYTPPAGSPDSSQPASRSGSRAVQPADGSSSSFRQPLQTAAGGIDWRSAIREVGKVASLGNGQQGLDLGGIGGGGDKGFAESGPLSFETQWYDWGEYAQSMVSRIRVNWYANMPSLINTGLKGVVTIRFTIHRDGRITDVMIIASSNIPPYDFAAKKAIEISSPLNPLPKDFPKETERVTAMFYYNMEPPRER